MYNNNNNSHNNNAYINTYSNNAYNNNNNNSTNRNSIHNSSAYINSSTYNNNRSYSSRTHNNNNNNNNKISSSSRHSINAYTNSRHSIYTYRKRRSIDPIRAIYSYCSCLGTRLPVYDTKHIPSGGYSCCLTLPADANCPVVVAHQGSYYTSKFAASRSMCRILCRRGELDQGYNTLRAPPRRQIQSFNGVTITFKRQIELDLLTIPFRILSYVLAHPPMTCSWSVLGEAFLKFFLATYFFSRHAFEMEGPLTTRVQNESDPAILSSYLRSSGLLGNVRTYAHYTEKTAGRYLCQVVGAAAFFGSVDNAIKVARTLGLVFDSSTYSMENIFNLYSFYLSNLRIPPAMRDDWILGKIERVQEILGYKFFDKGLLLEAICHGVSQSLSLTFQRIEFLGDAVLEYVVADHYLRKYPRMPMEDFRAYKSLILCNSTLGCLFLALGLVRYFDSGSRWPGSDWRHDTRNVIQNLNNGSDWIHIRPNKKLADGMEAIVGAIFIDSKFMIGPVENVLRRTLYPFIDSSMLATKIGARKRLLSSVLDN